MNFFQHQEYARSKTRWLLFVYVFAVVAIVIALDSIFLFVKYLTVSEYPHTINFTTDIKGLIENNVSTLLLFSLAIIVFISLASLFRVLTLQGGGSKVASALGGTLVDATHPDRRVRRLVNIVEEMAIASGLPVPQVYVLEQESGINAFAAGHQPEDAAVAVTRGALEIFNRDEMQGVLGHEFSHILNGDMRMNMRLLGPLFGITLIGMMGNTLLRSAARSNVRSSRESSGGALVVLVLGAGLAIIGYIGQLAGRMIKAAISRQREYLADASAVQFTRQKEGIGRALKKIAAWQHGSILADSGTEEVSHMLFANGLQKQFSSLFATHPPIKDRLQRMGIVFDNQELARLAVATQQISINASQQRSSAKDESMQKGFIADSEFGFTKVYEDSFNDETLNSARTLLDHIPDKIRAEVESENTVREVILALLLNNESEIKEQQLKVIRSAAGADINFQRVVEVRQQLDGLSQNLRLPILDLGFPAIRHLTWQTRWDFYTLVERLILLDGQVNSFEYMLSRLFLQMLEEHRFPDSSSGKKQIKLHRLQYHLRTLFSVVALFGHDDEQLAIRAYNAGMDNLFGSQQWPQYYMPADWIAHFDAALAVLDRARPLIKEEIINSLMVIIGFDNDYRIEEYEMLRVISALLHCPMPLVLDDL
jgi:Zn-dependent protease with chaperone function